MGYDTQNITNPEISYGWGKFSDVIFWELFGLGFLRI
jgi:hypothetical protein